MRRLDLHGCVWLWVLALGSLGAGEVPDLIEAERSQGGWTFLNGPEFPGATGALTLVPDASGKGRAVLKLEGDFTKGGNYVQASIALKGEHAELLSFKLKAPGAGKVTMRLTDGSKQVHQIDLRLEPRDDWQTVEFPILDFFKQMGTPSALKNVSRYEKWGGPNDGKWHAPLTSIAILATRHTRPNSLQPEIQIAEFRLGAVQPAFAEDFEAVEALPKGWEARGSATVVDESSPGGKRALKLKRALEQRAEETVVRGPVFSVTAGTYLCAGACRTELHSPDNSYNLTVAFEALKADGEVLEAFTLHEPFGAQAWGRFEKRIELPIGAVAARLNARLNKATGLAWVDELSVTPVRQALEKRVERIVLTTARLGNLLFPEDDPAAHVRIEALRELRPEECKLSFSVRDYWGAEQAAAGAATLVLKEKASKRFIYETDLNLAQVPLEVGRYYELHVALPRAKGEPETEFTGLARLPEAAARQYKAADLQFTIRNWDNRVKEYIHLSERLGFKTVGLWGGWSSKPPYAPHLPCLELCKELKLQWLTTTPASSVEDKGFKDYDETALREGVKNFLKAYSGEGLGMIALGNEPHGKREKVKENVRAYQCIYEEIKKFDPRIFVIGTSVEPNADYFEEGYYRYLDAYDFHVYGSYKSVRSAMREYYKLMNQYNAVKPLFSTELGLNSQGMPRLDVAVEMVKTLTVFFAEGGANASWFTINYPDPQGKARGASGDAHCVFDCKYSKYNPRLDAVTYYNMLNGICVKKFVAEKTYPDGTQAYLFRDASGQCMLALWNDTGRKEIGLALAGVTRAVLQRIDGGRCEVSPEAETLTVSVSSEPVVLYFSGKEVALPEALKAPGLTATTIPKSLERGQTGKVVFRAEGLTPEALRMQAPPLWKATRQQAGAGNVECRIEVLAGTAAREARMTVQLLSAGGAITGEITLTIPVAGKAP